MKSLSQRPKVKEILEHPSFPDTIWKLKPSLWGKMPVGISRGGPFNLDWEVHGTGEIKLALIAGLGSIKTSWQRSTLKYGHEQGDKYSVLVVDNRGIGKSEKPILRYSTSEMALDLIEIFDMLGWIKDHQIHIVGVSMGGMIAQEVAYQIPNRICSLNLVSTAAKIENTTTFFENMQTRIRMLVPKTLERSIFDSSQCIFPEEWLFEPDNSEIPVPGTPNVEFPPSGNYGKFSTNYERYAAHELHKRLDTEAFGRKGFLLQLIAAGWHYKSPEQLKEIGDKVGRDRIMVLHGTADRMITVPHGKKLIEWLQPGTAIIEEGIGHAFISEKPKYYNQLIENMIENCEALNKKNME